MPRLNLDAGRANRSNWEAYGKAAQRFNDFILNGKIPADLVSLPAAAQVPAELNEIGCTPRVEPLHQRRATPDKIPFLVHISFGRGELNIFSSSES